MSEQTIHTLALHVSGLFHAGTRRFDDGHSRDEDKPFIRVLPHHGEAGFEQWIQDMCFAAHADGEGDSMLPDDWKYRMIERAVDIIAEARDEEAAEAQINEEEGPIYTSELLAWLSSHLWRPSYADEAAKEYGVDEKEDGIVRRCTLGYVYELRMVFDSVMSSLKARAEELAEAETAGA